MVFKSIIGAICACLAIVSYSTTAAVLTGPIQGLQGSQDPFYWGDGLNDLFQEWSVNQNNCCGWFYGSSYSSSNVDVYVYAGLSDPTTVDDASVFSYFDSSSQTYPSPYGPSQAAWAQEGDTVFFRGVNGYYGAWVIDDIYFDPTNPVDFAALDGTWYFIDDGSSDFTSSGVVPVPAAVWLFGSGLFGLIGVASRKVRV